MGIDTIAEANRFITEVYLPAHNRRFMVDSAEPWTALIPWAAGHPISRGIPRGDRIVNEADNSLATDSGQLDVSPTALHIRSTPNRVSGTGAFKAADSDRPRTIRVSSGSMIPSSQRRAVAK